MENASENGVARSISANCCTGYLQSHVMVTSERTKQSVQVFISNRNFIGLIQSEQVSPGKGYLLIMNLKQNIIYRMSDPDLARTNVFNETSHTTERQN